jgi:hypothetical protein
VALPVAFCVVHVANVSLAKGGAHSSATVPQIRLRALVELRGLIETGARDGVERLWWWLAAFILDLAASKTVDDLFPLLSELRVENDLVRLRIEVAWPNHAAVVAAGASSGLLPCLSEGLILHYLTLWVSHLPGVLRHVRVVCLVLRHSLLRLGLASWILPNELPLVVPGCLHLLPERMVVELGRNPCLVPSCFVHPDAHRVSIQGMGQAGSTVLAFVLEGAVSSSLVFLVAEGVVPGLEFVTDTLFMVHLFLNRMMVIFDKQFLI